MKIINTRRFLRDWLKVETHNLSILEGAKVSIYLEVEDKSGDLDYGARIFLSFNDRVTGIEFEDRFHIEELIKDGEVAIDLDVFCHCGDVKGGFLSGILLYISEYTTIRVIYDPNEKIDRAVRFELEIKLPNKPIFKTEVSVDIIKVSGLMRLGVAEQRSSAS